MALYQDPQQIQPIVVEPPDWTLGVIPNRISLSDPIMLRHTLCLIIVIRNCFHVYLCWRQLRLCSRCTEPPPQMEGLMSQATFLSSKNKEMHEMELNVFRIIVDAIFSCLELHLNVFLYLWKMTMQWYHDVGDVEWNNMVFMALLASYMALRTMPSVLYDKLILDHFYHVDPEKVAPLVGLLCAFAFFVVLIQVALIPGTVIFLFIETEGGFFFVVWIWCFIVVVSSISLLLFNLFGAPCLGKSVQLTDGSLFYTLKDVLKHFHFPTKQIYILETFNIRIAAVHLIGVGAKRRLLILKNFLYNQGKSPEELFEDDVGIGLSDSQIGAIVAHELSHWKKRHFIKSFVMWQISLLIYLLLFGTCYHQEVLYEAAGFSNHFYPHTVGYWLVYKYVMPPYLTITNWIIFYFMRQFEYTADSNTWRLGYGQELKSALSKLCSDSQTFPLVDRWYQMWYRMHPSLLQRFRNIDSREAGTRLTRIELI